MKVRVAHSSLPKLGEKANGDRPFFRQDDQGRSLIAVIDGLGHGYEAQVAALAALRYLSEVPLNKSLEEIMPELHQGMRGTRGAAGTVCINDGVELSACAVGNVELRPIRSEVPLISSAGILGVRVQRFRVCKASLKPGCRLVIFSDGLANPTSMGEYHNVEAQLACDGLLRRHRRTYDDATVLIADFE
ncbi:MAG TPA: SpoIIE family protein phosphatase [Polyangiaceae bacterium]|nr:SpoIIE family protein phosphatase [Polyangiaceae bacterium]